MASSNTTLPATGQDSNAVVIAVLANVIAALVLFGIACSVEVSHLREAWQHKVVALVGLAAQWVVMPGMACAFARAFALPTHLAFTLICIGCAPGGTSSNTLSYFSNGDMALSLFLTSVTNVLALGTLPLSLFIWTSWAGLPLSIPFDQIALALFVVLLPAGGGVALRAKRPQTARKCERIGAAFGAIVTVLAVLVGVLGNREALTTRTLLPGGAWAAVALAAPCGMLFAFLSLVLLAAVSHTACHGHRGKPDALSAFGARQAVAVVLETGIQNVPLAIAVTNVTLASTAASADDVLATVVLSAMWTVITTTFGVPIMLVARWWQRLPLCPPCPPALRWLYGATDRSSAHASIPREGKSTTSHEAVRVGMRDATSEAA
jgi:predicted Na+-dependent transporter